MAHIISPSLFKQAAMAVLQSGNAARVSVPFVHALFTVSLLSADCVKQSQTYNSDA